MEPPVNSAEIFEKVRTLYSEERLEESLEELNKIDRNDTSYIEALVDRSEVLIDLKEYDEAVKVCREGLGIDSDNHHSLYINLSVAFIRSEKYDEALAVLDEGIKKFPKSYLLHYNKGAVYNARENTQEALAYFKKSVELNPYYGQGHLILGLLAAAEGKVAQAMLSLNMFLVLEPNSSQALPVLQQLNEMVSSKYDREAKNITLSPEGGDNFSEVDLIITNYVALDKSYKVPVKTQLSLIKQNHALFSKLNVNSKDKGFWMRTYVPFFKNLMDQGMFAPFSYYILQASGNDSHQKLVKKNQDEISKFVTWAVPQLNTINSVRELDFNGKKQEVTHLYNARTHTVEVIGTQNKASGKFTGYAELYFTTGNLYGHGLFDENGERTGIWKYYHENNNLSEEISLKAGKLDGPFKIYYRNGVVKREGTYKDGKQVEIQKEYNKAGQLVELSEINDDQLHGKLKMYYDLGESYKEYSGKYNVGQLHDTLYSYYDDGKLSFTKVFKNGVVDGEFISYHRNGKLATKMAYVSDKPHGSYKTYYPDGQLQQEGTYTNGIQTGLWKKYYPDGKLEEEVINDEKGKKNGVLKSYDTDGKLYYEMDFLKGEVVAYKYYDKQGKILKEDKRQKGEFQFVGYFPSGAKRMEGIYSKVGKKGTWKYYDEFGNLSSEEVYNDNGELHGKYKSYYVNGQVKEETEFKNDQQNGYSVKYYINGKIQEEGWNSNAKAQGYWKEYYANGVPESKSYFLDGKLRGYQQHFYITGKLEKEEYYLDNMLEKVIFYDTTGAVTETVVLTNGTGIYKSSHPNKKAAFSGNYVAGIATGEFKWNHYNGKTNTIGNYHNNERNGLWKWYFDNGNLSYEATYFFGEKEGKVKEYYESGKLLQVENYVNGKQHGEELWYYENGKPEIKRNFAFGKEHGEAFYYDAAGEVQMVRYYENGKIVAGTWYTADGKFAPRVEFNKPEYSFTSYYKNGNKAREYSVSKGVFHGKYTEYHSNGKVAEVTEYKHDLAEGLNTMYYPDGKKEAEKIYSSGYLNGPCKYYHTNGKMKEELNYIMGKIHGEYKFYDINGKLKKVQVYYSGEVIKEINY